MKPMNHLDESSNLLMWQNNTCFMTSKNLFFGFSLKFVADSASLIIALIRMMGMMWQLILHIISGVESFFFLSFQVCREGCMPGRPWYFHPLGSNLSRGVFFLHILAVYQPTLCGYKYRYSKTLLWMIYIHVSVNYNISQLKYLYLITSNSPYTKVQS